MPHILCFHVRRCEFRIFGTETDGILDQGQAGAQAVEDSVALGITLSGLTKQKLLADPKLLSQRLDIFQNVRKNRAGAMQIFSNAGQDQAKGIAAAVKPYLEADVKIPSNPAEFMVYNFGHDVRKETIKALAKEEGKPLEENVIPKRKEVALE